MTEIQSNQNPDKLKNSNISIALMCLNLILAYALSFIVQPAGEEKLILSLFCVLITAVICLLIYAFSYHGKGYRWAKWLLVATIVATIVLFAGLFLLYI